MLSLAEERNDSGIAALLLVSALMIIVGTTFAGADWSSGSMSNQLLFEPRRPKVWLAKGAAVLVGTLVASAVILTAFWLTLYLVAESRGIQTGAQVQEQIRWLVGRGVLLAGLGGLGGYALTMLVRHTVGTLAALFAYVVGGEALIAALPVEGAARWSLSNNVFAWVRDGHRYFDESIRCPPGPALQPGGAAHAGRGGHLPRRAARRGRGGVGAAVPPSRHPLTPPYGAPAHRPVRRARFGWGASRARRTVAGVTHAPTQPDTTSGGAAPTGSISPEGRKLLRLEVRNAQTPIEKKPEWIKTRARMGPQYTELQNLVKSEGLHTVCQEAGCPNIFECWEDREATFLIGGDQCTRRCDFCQIDTGKPQPLDRDEPRRVAESVQTMGLRYATITGVARDDLPDGGAWLYAETVRAIHELNPDTGVENLIPDFNGKPDLLQEVFESRPEVLAHNVETVPRIFKRIRPAFRYDRSLDVLTQAREFGLVTKSNLILGMGETREEVSQALRDLHEAGCDLITITQYLRPSPRHHPVERWVKPEEFVELHDEALEIGFAGVMSGPLVRSSYRAGRLYKQALESRERAGQPV